jgi:hypothetical protein
MLLNHHHHYRRKRVIDLYLELSIVTSKLAALYAIIPSEDPEPYLVELVKSKEYGEFLVLPQVIESY